MQKLLLEKHRQAMRANFGWNAQRTNRGEDTTDFRPVVKLFTPWASATWLLTELDPADNDTIFGLCDLGQGTPELGYVSLREIEGLRHGRTGLRVERDIHARLDKPLSFYAELARRTGRITV